MANGTQLLNQVRDGLKDLETASLGDLRKMARALRINVSNGQRYFRRDELIASLKASGKVYRR